ncbi:cysteine proteinase [Lentinula raphanica]|uniref:ubiquitinyl hydrolase 1 n=1 Tax=Lentinula raphanica TaxID=153919 RepID=A0AA38UJL2_9AGAR|nr:cysteine proteinase [Lentinula raphanica]
MAKSKAPTPQELYRARKQQEEQERLSLLPPGLINHGNTCFMNSVLQGLIATRLLSQLVHFEPIPPQVQEHSHTPLASQRSPQLTNGHDLGGIYEQKWDNSMPIGDVFITTMYRAWEAQRLRKRESMSPNRLLLTTLGRKYDQYTDFAQQDAHEFLRILLDAMRMEELDVIKKRQPSTPSNKGPPRRRSTITPADVHSVPDRTDDDQEDPSTRLISLSDMLFGGQLTSILVCQKCKNISQTYEDFNDLSLSIKPEDYAREKKRDKFKKFARKMTNLDAQPAPNVDASGSRSSSVPPTTQKTNGIDHHDDSRRRSMDELTNGNSDATITDDDDEDAVLINVSTDDESNEKPLPHPPGLGPPTPEEKRLEFADAPKLVRSDKSRDRDSWARIGRRISMSVGIGKKGKEKDRDSRPSRGRYSADLGAERSRSPLVESAKQPEIRLSRPSVSPERPQSTPPIFLKRPSLSQDQVITFKKSKPRPQSLTPSPSDSAVPTVNGAFSRSQSPNHHHQHHRAKSPQLSKPSKAEAEYLRAILADIQPTPVTGSHPFDFLTSWTHSIPGDDPQASSSSLPSAAFTSSPTPSSTAATWLAKLGQLPLAGIEECLRMFTAVEVLDGENMVGCRRCWQLANGWYEERARKRKDKGKKGGLETNEDGSETETSEDDSEDSEDDRDEESDDEQESEGEDVSPLTSISTEEPDSTGIRKTSSAPASPTLSHNPLSSFSSPTLGLYVHGNTSNAFSVISSPPDVAGKNHRPIPLICTTDVEEEGRHSPSLPTAKPDGQSFSLQSELSPPQDIPFTSSQGPQEIPPSLSSNAKNHLDPNAPTSHTTGYDSDDGESDATSISTATSALASGLSVESLTDTSMTDPSEKPAKKPKGAKPVIMRPAYKRYLIATPPPVLVIHLKRFQQTSKNPIMSFSSGFKKLEDYVAFPEFFDLTPFLAPRKEDFGLGRRRKKSQDGVRRSKGDKERCMYRLYAVVVHIGNMLGGHYISYTALPNKSDIPAASSQADSTTDLPPPPTGGPRQWAYISDTVVRLTTLQEVLKAKAYICMYERV